MATQGFNVSLMGLIGAGKTTLAAEMSDLLGVPLYKEGVENVELLHLFYEDQARYGFTLQIHLLTNRLQQQHAVTWNEAGGIQDRSFYEDLAFASLLTRRGAMDSVQLKTYTELFHTVMRTMKHPWIVYLKVKPEKALERIRLRNRPMEQNITLDYLTQLAEEYETLLRTLADNAHVNVLQLDWNEFVSVDRVVDAIRVEMARHTGIIECQV